MFFSWFILTISICALIYFVIMLFYNKALLSKEKKFSENLKNQLDETEIILRKLQLQLQRSLGNIDILNEELEKVKNDLSLIRAKNSDYHLENKRLQKKIKELEARVKVLL